MKKCFVKGIAVAMAMVMTAGVMAGCGGNSAQPAESAAPAAESEAPAEDAAPAEEGGEEAAAPAEDDGEVYHMVMEIVNFGFDDPDIQMVQDAVNERTIPEIGVEVEFMTVPIMEMGTKLGLMISGGEQIDLACTGLTTNPQRLAAEGSLMPITEYIENSEILKSATEGVIDACRYNGEIYSVPGVTAAGIETAYYYDKALAEQYNIELPDRLDTPEKWEALFSQIKESGMEQYAISLGDGAKAELSSTGYAFDCLGDKGFCANGVILNGDDTNTVVNLYATDLYKEKCMLHKEWYDKGYCVPDSISNTYTTTDSMKQGTVFGIINNHGSGMNEGNLNRTTGKTLGVIPTGDVVIQAANVTALAYGISASCERPDKVIKFLELLFSDADFINLMNFGIEGVHYVTTEGSNVINYPEGVDPSSCGWGNFLGIPCDNSKAYYRAPLTDDFAADMERFSYNPETASKYLGYTFNTDAVTTEISAVTSVINQYAPALECGVVDPEEMIPQFVDALNAAGMEKIIEENQRQLDEWLASQN